MLAHTTRRMEQRRYHIKRTCYACLFLPSSLRRLEEEADAEGEAADDDARGVGAHDDRGAGRNEVRVVEVH